QAGHVTVLQLAGTGAPFVLDVPGPAGLARGPIVGTDGLPAREHALVDRGLRDGPVAAVHHVEHGALLGIDPDRAEQAAGAAHHQVGAPARALLAHRLHGRLAQVLAAAVDAVARHEGLQHVGVGDL